MVTLEPASVDACPASRWLTASWGKGGRHWSSLSRWSTPHPSGGPRSSMVIRTVCSSCWREHRKRKHFVSGRRSVTASLKATLNPSSSSLKRSVKRMENPSIGNVCWYFSSHWLLPWFQVYLPCVLQTKKRYVGFMYESLDQKEPEFDAKGIETVRRDGCPAVAKVSLEVIDNSFIHKHPLSFAHHGRSWRSRWSSCTPPEMCHWWRTTFSASSRRS